MDRFLRSSHPMPPEPTRRREEEAIRGGREGGRMVVREDVRDMGKNGHEALGRWGGGEIRRE